MSDVAFLWSAVDQLTKPRHVKLLRDEGSADWTTVPSLWWQLEDAVTGVGDAGGEGGASSRYRSPGSIDCLQLYADIRDTVVDALLGHEQKPRTVGEPPAVVAAAQHRRAAAVAQRRAYATYGIADDSPLVDVPERWRVLVPDSLRALASLLAAVADDDLTAWWTERVRSWSRQITNTLRLSEQPQPRRIRDTACPTCAATHVTLDQGSGPERVPALLIDFHGALIRAASCSACGSNWFRGSELLDLADMLDATRRQAAIGGEVA